MGKALILVLALVGCAHRMSQADGCRIGASFEHDPAVKAARMSTCEQVATRESIERMHAEDMAERRAERAAVAREAESERAPERAPAPSYFVASDETTQVMMFRKPDDFYGMLAASEAGVETRELADGFRLHGGIWIDNGTRCTLLEVARPLARVRLLSGQWEGTQGWVPVEDVEER